MNRRLRVLLIGRHFWPHISIDSAGFLFQFACLLHRHGVHVEVISPRYASSWPEEFSIREIPVHRPAAAPRSDWSMGRYIRHLTTWLRQNGGSFDILLVDGIREESSAAIEAARVLGCPTALLCSGWGMNSDPMWWRTSRSARKCGAIGKMADAVIAKNAACQRALLADGYAASRIARIDHGFAAGPIRSAPLRRAARKVLSTVNGDLMAPEDATVVLCTSRMTREGGVNLLVKAAPFLIARYRDLRLWFVGDGPYRDWLYEHLRGEGVRASIAMPGSFCDVQDLYAAADLFVQTDDDGLDFLLPSAVSAELPVVAIDSESTRAVLGTSAGENRNSPPGPQPLSGDPDHSLVEFVPGATSKLLRMGITRVLENLPVYQGRASQLRRKLLREHPQIETVQAYVALMERLVREKSSSGRSSSIEAVS